MFRTLRPHQLGPRSLSPGHRWGRVGAGHYGPITKTKTKTKTMHTINHYTGQWQRALTSSPKLPRVGALVRIHENPDAREIDDFRARLFANGLQIGQWQRAFPRLKMDTYRIEKLAS